MHVEALAGMAPKPKPVEPDWQQLQQYARSGEVQPFLAAVQHALQSGNGQNYRTLQTGLGRVLFPSLQQQPASASTSLDNNTSQQQHDDDPSLSVVSMLTYLLNCIALLLPPAGVSPTACIPTCTNADDDLSNPAHVVDASPSDSDSPSPLRPGQPLSPWSPALPHLLLEALPRGGQGLTQGQWAVHSG